LYKKNACTAEFEKIFEQANGIVFFGGPDIPPGLYGEQTSLLAGIEDPYRHYLELSFVFHLLGGFQDESFRPLLERRPQLPVTGFCLGCQSLNVGTGGTLTQDIWSEVYSKAFFEDVIAMGPDFWHSNPYSRLSPQEKLTGFYFHAIRLEPGKEFWRKIGFEQRGDPLILSAHHQQAEKLGKGFRVIATSLDGKVVEAIAHNRYAHVLGVQFHPEAAILYDPESRVRFRPQEKEPLSPKAYLEEHPPSTEFHRKLWSWISQTWVENHRSRRVD
ncbi:MAG: gamma-glutamyl-gamma-aminobutyrate hydrolase family protein, partial [Acidobacteriota bacterium]